MTDTCQVKTPGPWMAPLLGIPAVDRCQADPIWQVVQNQVVVGGTGAGIAQANCVGQKGIAVQIHQTTRGTRHRLLNRQ